MPYHIILQFCLMLPGEPLCYQATPETRFDTLEECQSRIQPTMDSVYRELMMAAAQHLAHMPKVRWQGACVVDRGA